MAGFQKVIIVNLSLISIKRSEKKITKIMTLSLIERVESEGFNFPTTQLELVKSSLKPQRDI